MQIYKDMNIGTAKVLEDEMQGIKHYMLDIISPEERYSVSDFKKQSEECIEQILQKGKMPIICGGTGLYINSLIYGLEFENEEIAQNEGLENLYKKALEIDPEAANKISKNDQKRIIRILEIYHKTGKTKTQQDLESRKNEVKYDYKVFGINMDRQVLYDRINQRVDIMLKQGLIEEVQSILEKYNKFPTAMQGLRI